MSPFYVQSDATGANNRNRHGTNRMEGTIYVCFTATVSIAISMINPSIITTTLPPFRLQLRAAASKAFLTAPCYANRHLSTSLRRNTLSTKQNHQEATSPHKRRHSFIYILSSLCSFHIKYWLRESFLVLRRPVLLHLQPLMRSAPFQIWSAETGSFFILYISQKNSKLLKYVLYTLTQSHSSISNSHNPWRLLLRFYIAKQRRFQISSLTDLLNLRGPSLTLFLNTSMSKALQIPKWLSQTCEKLAISLMISNGLRWVYHFWNAPPFSAMFSLNLELSAHSFLGVYCRRSGDGGRYSTSPY